MIPHVRKKLDAKAHSGSTASYGLGQPLLRASDGIELALPAILMMIFTYK